MYLTLLKKKEEEMGNKFFRAKLCNALVFQYPLFLNKEILQV